MKKKQLHVILKYFYPVAAGIETNTLETYSVMARNGWDITIHTSQDTATAKNVLKREEALRGLKIKRYAFGRFGFFPSISWSETDVVALHNFDMFPHLQILLYAYFLKITGNKKFALVLTPHGGFNPEWSVFGKIDGFIKRTYHYTLGTFLINHTVDAVRTVSEWERKEMESKNVQPSLISVITNGIENEAFANLGKLVSPEMKEKVEGFGRYIIQIGRIYMIKNYETAIKALRYVPADVKFVIAGAADKNPSYKKIDYMDTLKKLIKELGLRDRVIFVGVVRGVDKYYLVKKAQMMVHMALWESYCNVVHEGMSQGLPCIVANNTALPLLIKDGVNGYTVATLDDKTLAKRINDVLENKNKKVIKDMAALNKQITRENSWENVAGKVDRLYTKLLSAKGKRNQKFVRGKSLKVSVSK